MMLILTTSSANTEITDLVNSIIDGDGNEYKLKSFTNGASNWNQIIELTTGVPIKCTYTFGNILPEVKFIKLFKYIYYHNNAHDFDVEFRDIPIEWQQ